MKIGKLVSAIVCGALAAVLVAKFQTGSVVRAENTSAPALTGVVSSQQEGKMEGVVVTARPDGGNYTVSVVSDAQGKYSFPSSHLKPGTYNVKMRAVGYDLVDPGSVDVAAGKTATLDLKLVKTADLSKQLTSVEWLMSLKGTDAQKAMVQKQMESCTYCHTLELIVKSTHTADEFPAIITRMNKYYPDGSGYGFHEGRGRRKVDFEPELKRAMAPTWGYWPGVKKTDLGAYLADINMSGGKSLPSDLKMLPRPKGKETRVIVTEYDMPRPDTHAHDSDVDSKGRVWYTDQSAPYFGVFDPKTETFEEFTMPVSKVHPVTGASDVQVDKEDNVWFTKVDDSVNNHFGLLHKYDVKKKELIPVTKMPRNALYQFLAMGPDGEIWAGIGEFLRVDPHKLEVDWRYNWQTSPNVPKNGPYHMGYELAVDAKGNPWLNAYSDSGLVTVDVKTKNVRFYATPTKDSGPRRGVFDSEGRFWFGEYSGDKIGMYDPKTDKITEYDPGIKWFSPYTASNMDKKGRVYAPSNVSDRIARVDSKTGEVITYLMPTQDFDTKQMRIDPVSGSTLLFANTRSARIVKVEPLD
jgi:streptogramin lyase